eukprot:Gb_05386 [translate_table: standard]
MSSSGFLLFVPTNATFSSTDKWGVLLLRKLFSRTVAPLPYGLNAVRSLEVVSPIEDPLDVDATPFHLWRPRKVRTYENKSDCGWPYLPLHCFSDGSSGLLPMLIVNVAILMAAIKHKLSSLMGFSSGEEVAGQVMQPAVYEAPYENNSSAHAALGSGLAHLLLLAEEMQNSPSLSFSESNGFANADCAVCLSRFEERDEIRVLSCSHVFHKTCIATWMDYQRLTCPLCRTSQVSEQTARHFMRNQQEITEELLLWFSSFHGGAFHSLW